MIDFHTHILPGMDDGAASEAESIALLKQEAEQQVDTVVLTPHFYREQEPRASFLKRREESLCRLNAAIAALPEQEQSALPRLVMGAEVAWCPNMEQWNHLDDLCIGATRNMLLELPMTPWNDYVLDSLYSLCNSGITPVLAHLDRYFHFQSKTMLRRVVNMGFPFQVNSTPLLRRFAGRHPLRLLVNEEAAVLSSDCHNLTRRPPTIAEATQLICKKYGQETLDRILSRGETLLTPNAPCI